jgi:site-specific DNA-methyltransferase (adenine-specific)
MATARYGKPTASGDSYATPPWLYGALHHEFRFTLDPCPLNPTFHAADEDGLALDWDGHTVFVNPPYSNILPWVEKALTSKATTVLLVPVRSSQLWFHLLLQAKVEMRYFRKRIAFSTANGQTKKSPTEDSVVVIIRR